MTRDVSDVTHRKHGLRFEKSQLVEFCSRKKKVDFHLLAGALRRVRSWFGADGNIVIERLCLSLPYVEKPFNSKVIKSFVPELRSHKCFLCFGIPMLSMYVRYGHYERFADRYEYVYFTYSCMAMLQNNFFNCLQLNSHWLFQNLLIFINLNSGYHQCDVISQSYCIISHVSPIFYCVFHFLNQTCERHESILFTFGLPV